MTDTPDSGEDMDDIAEDGSWICPNVCGAGGRCVKGDEGQMEFVHLMFCPNS